MNKPISPLCSENLENANTVTVTPTSGAAVFRKDSVTTGRPSTLHVTSPGQSPPMSSPIPVPTQVAAYQRMQCHSPNSPLSHEKSLVPSGTSTPRKASVSKVQPASTNTCFLCPSIMLLASLPTDKSVEPHFTK